MEELEKVIKKMLSDTEFTNHLKSNYIWESSNVDKKDTQTLNLKKIDDKNFKYYKPRTTKLEQLSSGTNSFYNEFGHSIERLSPFPRITDYSTSNVFKISIDINTAYSNYIQRVFNNEQIFRMHQDVETEVINRLLDLTGNAFEDKRHRFFDSGFLFFDEFEEMKLKYLLEHGEEAIEISQEDYTLLKTNFLQLVKDMLTSTFKVAKTKFQEGILQFNIDEESYFNAIHKFYTNISKHFSWANNEVKRTVFYSFIDVFDINGNNSYLDVQDYKELTFCPFMSTIYKETNNYLNFSMEKSIFLSSVDFKKLEYIFRKEEIISLIKTLVNSYEIYYEKYNSGEIAEKYDSDVFLLQEGYSGLSRVLQFLENIK